MSIHIRFLTASSSFCDCESSKYSMDVFDSEHFDKTSTLYNPGEHLYVHLTPEDPL